jgi:hypothetical protein
MPGTRKIAVSAHRINNQAVAELSEVASTTQVTARRETGSFRILQADSDGQYKMAAYAHSGLETAGLSYFLSNEEKENLKKSGSSLLPYFSKHVIT